MMESTALRKSIFPGVPPYINFVPIGGFSGEVIRGPQYWDEDKWDQDQLWRFTLAMEKWINQCVESEGKSTIADWDVTNNLTRDKLSSTIRRNQRRSKTQSLMISNPFEQRPDDSKKFSENHYGVKLTQFPKMRQISRKDMLGQYFHKMQEKFGLKDFDFHPRTFVMPEDFEALKKNLVFSKKDLWIVKPPNLNNGHGVYVINGMDLPKELDLTKPSCVQKYIKNPLLINGLKFDVRIYVLLTSLDPLKIFMYDDGLVRIATETYTEDPDLIKDSCIHVTNYDVNRKNTAKFVQNSDPSQGQGHKWRLKVLWKYLGEIGFQEYHFEYIWDQIEEAVVKSILVALPDMRKEYQEMVDVSTYNTYKLLGYDMMIDNDLKVHVLEVNGRPQLQSEPIDKSVNRPMLNEIMHIIGYHIPKSVGSYRQFISEKFNLGPDYGNNGHAMKFPVTYQYRIHTRVNAYEDDVKQKAFKDLHIREEYLDKILKEISPMDLRMLIKAEEELSQTKNFTRLFPSAKSHQYFKYFYDDGIPYYDRLLDAWEHKYGANRAKGIRKLKKYCNKAIHL